MDKATEAAVNRLPAPPDGWECMDCGQLLVPGQLVDGRCSCGGEMRNMAAVWRAALAAYFEAGGMFDSLRRSQAYMADCGDPIASLTFAEGSVIFEHCVKKRGSALCRAAAGIQENTDNG